MRLFWSLKFNNAAYLKKMTKCLSAKCSSAKCSSAFRPTPSARAGGVRPTPSVRAGGIRPTPSVHAGGLRPTPSAHAGEEKIRPAYINNLNNKVLSLLLFSNSHELRWICSIDLVDKLLNILVNIYFHSIFINILWR